MPSWIKAALLSALLLPSTASAVSVCLFDFEGADSCGAWTGAGTANEWQIGVPQGVGGGSTGCTATTLADPASAPAGTRVAGTDLGLPGFLGTAGLYQPSSDQTLTSPVVNLGKYSSTTLSFRRWLNIEANWDFAYLEVDNGNGVWQRVWSSIGATFADAAWVPTTVDLATVADGKSAVRFRFRVTSDSSCNFSGLAVDLVDVQGVDKPPAAPADVWAEDVGGDTGGSLLVRWLASADDGAGAGDLLRYDILRSTSAAGPFSVVTTALPGVTRWTDPAATTGTSYFYKVRAVDAAGATADSPVSAVAVSRANGSEPEAPMLLSPAGCADVPSGRPSYTWQNGDDPDGGVNHLRVEVSDSPGFARSVFTESFESTAFRGAGTTADWNTAAGEARLGNTFGRGAVDQQQTLTASGCLYFSGATGYAQVFRPSINQTLYSVAFRGRLRAAGSRAYEMQIRAAPGQVVGTGILATSTVTITDAESDREFVFSSAPQLTANTEYVFVILETAGTSTSSLCLLAQNENPYAAGKFYGSDDGNATWFELGITTGNGANAVWTAVDTRFFTYRAATNYSQLVESTPVSRGLSTISQVTLAADATLPAGNTIVYQVRAAGSAAWQTVTPGAAATLTTPGTALQWRATLTTDASNETPVLRSVTLTYLDKGTWESRLSATGFSPAPPFFAGDGNGTFTAPSTLAPGTYFWRAAHWDPALSIYGVPSESGCFTVGGDELVWIESLGYKGEIAGGVGDEYVELYNPSAEDLSLVGYELCDAGEGCAAFPAGAVLPAGGFYTSAANAADFLSTHGFSPDFAFNPTRCTTSTCVNFADAGDELVIRRTGATVSSDAVVYGSYTGLALPEGSWSGTVAPSIAGGLTCKAVRRLKLTISGEGDEVDGPDADLSEENDEDLATNFRALSQLFPVGALTLSSTKSSLRTDAPDSTIITALAPQLGCSGGPAFDGTWFTASTTLGRLDAVDDHPIAPGIQIKVEGGKLAVTLRSGRRSGTARVTFTALRGDSTGFIDIPFVGGADHVQAVATDGVAPAGGTEVVTLRLVDPVNNPVVGAQSVTVSVTGSATITATTLTGATGLGTSTVTGTTANDGSATITVSDTAVETVTVTPDAALPKTVANVPATIAFSGGPATTLIVTGIASPLTSGTSASVTIEARDAFGNRANAYTGTIAFTSNDPAATLPGNVTFTLANAGLRTVSGVVLRTAGLRWVEATDTVTSTIKGRHANIDVRAAAANRLAVSGHPSPSTAGVTSSIAIVALDPSGNTDTLFAGAVVLSSNDPYPAELQSGVTLAAGQASASVRLKTAGTRSVTATSGGITGSQTGITVVAGVATTLRVSGIGTPITAGTPATVNVQAQDAFANAATATGALVFSSDDPFPAALPAGLSLVGGTASGTVTLKTAGTRSVTATAGALTGSQTGISVVAGAATELRLTLFGPSVTAGATVQGRVEALDGFGNRAATTGPLTWGSSDTQASLPLVGGVALVNGLADPAGPVVMKTAGNQSLTASAGSVTGSVTLDVRAAAAFALRVTGFPSPVVAGIAGNVRVQAIDAYGNDASTAGGLAFSSSDTQAALPAPGTISLVNGLTASAGPITLKTAGSAQNLVVTVGTLTGRQEPIEVFPAAASALALSGMPASFPAGAAQTLSVEARDPYGNRATGYAGTVRFLSSDVGSGVSLPAPTSFAGAGGVRTFSGGVTLATAGVQWVEGQDTLTDTIRGRHPDVTVLFGSSIRFVVDGVSDPAVAGAPQSVRVRVFDDGNNLVTNYAGTVALTSSDPRATLPAQHTFTLSEGGVHTFTGLVLKSAGAHVVTAAQVGDSTVFGSQSGIDVLAGPAAKLRVSGISSPVQAGVQVAAVVRALDDFDNDATASGAMTVTTTDTAAAVPAPGATSLTAGSGSTGLITFKTVGTWKVTVTAAGLSGEQIGIQVGPGTANRLLVTGFPNPADAGVAGTVRIEAVDAYGNRTSSAGPVTFTSDDTAAALPAPGAVSMSAGLVASAGPITLRTAGTRSVTAAVAGLSGAQTGITLRPAAAQRLVVTGFPSPTSACAAGTVKVEALDPFGNRATAATHALTFSSTDPGASLPAADSISLVAGLVNSAGPISFRATGAHTLTVSANGVTAGQQTGIQIGAGSAARLVMSAPSAVDAGSFFGVTVTALDACDNVASGFSGALSFTTTDNTDVIAASMSAGQGSAAGFRMTQAGAQTISASGGGLSGQTSVTVRPGPAVLLQLAATPMRVTAGDPIQAEVIAVDAFGNVATGYDGLLRFTVSDVRGDAQSDVPVVAAVHSGAISVPAAAHLLTAGTHSLTVADQLGPGVTGATLPGIVVEAAAAASLEVRGFPSPVIAGESTEVTVTTRDAFGNIATGYRGQVLLTSSDPSLPALRLSRIFDTLNSGVHTFRGVSFRTAGTQSLTAEDSDAGLRGVQTPITVLSAAADHVELTADDGVAIAGSEEGVTIRLKDRFNNNAAGPVAVTVRAERSATIASSTMTGGSLGNVLITGTVPASGTATVTITDQVAETVLIRPTAGLPQLRPHVTTTIRFVPAAPDHVVARAQDGVAPPGGIEPVTVAVVDRYGNTAPGVFRVAVAVSGSATIPTTSLAGASAGPNVTSVTGDTATDGTATLEVRDLIAEKVRVTPGVATLTATPVEALVDFLANEVDHVVATPTNPSPLVGATERIALQIVDSFGNAVARNWSLRATVAGTATLLRSSLGTPAGSAVVGRAAADGSGWVEITATAAGAVTVCGTDDPALDDGPAGQPDLPQVAPDVCATVIFQPGAPTRALLVSDGAAVAGVLEALLVKVADSYGNTVPGARQVSAWVDGEARFELTTLAGATAPAAALAGTTTAQGTASLDLLDERAETVNVCAALDARTEADLCVTVDVAPAAKHHLAVVPDAGTESLACGCLDVALWVEDEFGNPVPGGHANVTLAPGGSAQVTATSLAGAQPGASVTGAIPPTGAASATLCDNQAEPLLVFATSPSLTGAGVPALLTFKLGPPDAARSSLVVSQNEIVAGDDFASAFVDPRDACGLHLGDGHSVEVHAGVPLDAGAATYQVSGQRYVARLDAIACPASPTSTAAVLATVDGVELADAVQMRVVCKPVEPSASVVTVTDAEAEACAARDSVVLEVRPIDTLGHPLFGDFTVAVDADPPQILPRAASDQGDGLFRIEVGSDRCSGPRELTIRVGGVALATRPVVEFSCPPVDAQASTLTLTPALGRTGETLGVAINALNTCGWPAIAAPVALAVQPELGTFAKTRGEIALDGSFATNLTLLRRGSARVGANVGGARLDAPLEVFLPGDALLIALEPGQTSANVGDLVRITARVRSRALDPLLGLGLALELEGLEPVGEAMGGGSKSAYVAPTFRLPAAVPAGAADGSPGEALEVKFAVRIIPGAGVAGRGRITARIVDESGETVSPPDTLAIPVGGAALRGGCGCGTQGEGGLATALLGLLALMLLRGQRRNRQGAKAYSASWRAWRPTLLILILAAGDVRAQESAFHQRGPIAGGDALLDRADVTGAVFDDLDGDGQRDAREPGIEGAVISLGGGAYAVTGKGGLYHLAQVKSGQQIVALDLGTLPAGVGPSRSRLVVAVPPGGLAVVDFPVRSAREMAHLGRDERLGAQLAVTLEPEPAIVAGNARDQKLLVAGAPVTVPRADVELGGLERGGFLRAGGRAQARLKHEHRTEPRSWELALYASDSAQVGRRTGRGVPPASVVIDPDDPAIPMTVPFKAGEGYSLRLCVDFADGERACSPYRSFGIIGSAGGREVRPRLERPILATAATVGGTAAPLDPDSSFLAQVPPGSGPRVPVSLTGDDGRTAMVLVDLPSLTVETQLKTPLPDLSPAKLRVKGKAPQGARVKIADADVKVGEEGRFSIEITVKPGEGSFSVEALLPNGAVAAVTARTRLADKDAAGKRFVLEEAVPELLVELPPSGATVRAKEWVRGKTEPGNSVEINAVPVDVNLDGTFSASVDLSDAGAIQVRVRDARGRTGELIREVTTGDRAWSAVALAEGSPGARTGRGLAFVGDAVASARYDRGDAGRAMAAAGLSTPGGLALGAEILVGAERHLGPVIAGLRYGRSERLPLGDDEPRDTDDDLRLTAALPAGALTVYFDAGLSGGASLAGGGAGARLRLGSSATLSARAGATRDLEVGVSGTGAGIETSTLGAEWEASALWRPAVALDPALVLRVTRVTRTGGGKDDIGALGLSISLLPDMLRLEESVAVRRAAIDDVEGASTVGLVAVTRVSLRLTPRWLLAADHRLQLAGGGGVSHGATAEVDAEIVTGLRAGVVAETLFAAGQADARFLARLQAYY